MTDETRTETPNEGPALMASGVVPEVSPPALPPSMPEGPVLAADATRNADGQVRERSAQARDSNESGASEPQTQLKVSLKTEPSKKPRTDPSRQPGPLKPSDIEELSKHSDVNGAQKTLYRVQLAAGGRFVDPTRPLTPPRECPLLLDKLVIEQVSRLLRHWRLAAMVCCDAETLFSAAHAIASEPEFDDWEKLELTTGNIAKGEKSCTLRELLHPNVGSGGKTLIIAFADSHSSDDLLRSLPETPQELSVRGSDLGDSRQILVVTTPYYIGLAGARIASSCLIKLDFLKPWLHHKFPASADNLESRMRRQYEKGLWGLDEEAFHELFRDHVERGNLEQQVVDRERYVDEDNPQAAFRAHSVLQSGELIRDETPVENAVIFVATFFKKLPVNDFQRVLLALLSNRTIELESSTDKAPQQKPLRQIWADSRQRILKTCQLQILSTKPPTIQFEDSEARNAFELIFESRCVFIFDELSKTVDASGLLFDPSEVVSRAAMELTRKRIRGGFDSFGDEFLLSLLISFESDPDHSRAFARERIKNILLNWSESTRHLALTRIAALFALLIEDQSADAVDQALKTLLETGCYKEVLQLLARLGQSEFSERRIGLIRRVMDEADPDAKDAAYRLLYSWGSLGGAKAALVLSNVYVWRDNDGAPSAAFANRLLEDLSEWAMTSSTGLASHPIASALAADQLRARTLSEWLVEPAKNPTIHSAPETSILQSLLEFLWILPRPLPEDFFTEHHNLCSWVQATWTMVYHEALFERIHDENSPISLDDGLKPLVVIDSAITLSSDPGITRDPQSLDQLAAAVSSRDRNYRRRILAHCSAVTQALGACTEVVSFGLFTSDRASILLARQLKERWRFIRAGLTNFTARVRQSGAAVVSATGGMERV